MWKNGSNQPQGGPPWLSLERHRSHITDMEQQQELEWYRREYKSLADIVATLRDCLVLVGPLPVPNPEKAEEMVRPRSN
jgi:hypothetical protein